MNTHPVDSPAASVTVSESYAGVGLPVLATTASLVQGAALLLFAAAGALSARLAIAFLAIAAGSALAFLAYCTSGDNRAWREKQMMLPLLAVATAVQLGFLALAPNLAIVFLLALFVLFGFALLKLEPAQARIGWAVYGISSGVVMLLVKGRLGYPGISTLEFALIWAVFFLALRALILATGELAALRSKLVRKEGELGVAHARIAQLNRHDPLTGVLNRRGLLDMLDAELQRANRTGHPFCFATLDLDHFKSVNDRYGHATGDAVLKTVSETAMRLLRALDRFGRLDGEAFGIVLPATWLDQGAIAMSRLTKAVAEQDWSDIAPGLALTFSAGLTTNATGDTAESIILRAQKALGQAKAEGRNRVVQAEEALPETPAVPD